MKATCLCVHTHGGNLHRGFIFLVCDLFGGDGTFCLLVENSHHNTFLESIFNKMIQDG